jgi:hypothetical protein
MSETLSAASRAKLEVVGHWIDAQPFVPRNARMLFYTRQKSVMQRGPQSDRARAEFSMPTPR